jgi:hypothetical protein
MTTFDSIAMTSHLRCKEAQPVEGQVSGHARVTLYGTTAPLYTLNILQLHKGAAAKLPQRVNMVASKAREFHLVHHLMVSAT